MPTSATPENLSIIQYASLSPHEYVLKLLSAKHCRRILQDFLTHPIPNHYLRFVVRQAYSDILGAYSGDTDNPGKKGEIKMGDKEGEWVVLSWAKKRNTYTQKILNIDYDRIPITRKRSGTHFSILNRLRLRKVRNRGYNGALGREYCRDYLAGIGDYLISKYALLFF